MADESEAAPEAEPEAEAEPAAEPEAGAEPDAAALADGDDPATSLGLEGSVEEDAAAAKLQAMQRGKADRKKVEGLKIEKELGLTGSEEEQSAITKMQAMQRGRAARKAMAVKDEEGGGATAEDAAEEMAAVAQLNSAEETAAIEALYAKVQVDGDGKAAAPDLLKLMEEPADEWKDFATSWTDLLGGAAEAELSASCGGGVP